MKKAKKWIKKRWEKEEKVVLKKAQCSSPDLQVPGKLKNFFSEIDFLEDLQNPHFQANPLLFEEWGIDAAAGAFAAAIAAAPRAGYRQKRALGKH